jgi:hypothetical protein
LSIPTPEKDARAVLLQDNIKPVEAPHILKELTALNTLAVHVAEAPKKTK